MASSQLVAPPDLKIDNFADLEVAAANQPIPKTRAAVAAAPLYGESAGRGGSLPGCGFKFV